MSGEKRKYRIVIRPWIPRRKVHPIPMSVVEETINNNRDKLQKAIYAGWSRRIVDGKRTIVYLLATGITTREARDNFKKSEEFGENVWQLSS